MLLKDSPYVIEIATEYTVYDYETFSNYREYCHSFVDFCEL